MIVGELGLTFSDAIILTAVVAAFLKVLADYRGWTRSPALVRQENSDLRERNATLEAEVKRLDESDRRKGERIAALEAQVEELQKRDQAAVLEAIQQHEHSATVRHTENSIADKQIVGLLTEIRDRLPVGERNTG